MASIKRNFAYSGVLTTANYVFPLVTYPYVSRVIGVDNIGMVNFVDSVINYFVIVAVMGMAVLGVREIAAASGDKERQSRRFGALLWLNVATTSIALAVYAAACMCVEQLREHAQLLPLGALKIVFSAFLVEWLYRGLEDFRYITVRTLAVKAAYVCAVFALVRQADDYAMYYMLTVLMIGVNSAINLWHARRLVAWRRPSLSLMRGYAPAMLLMGLYTMLTAMYTTFNVSYLGFVCGDRQVGYYTTALKFFTILIGFYSAFTGVMMPRMSTLLSEGRMAEAGACIRRSARVLVTVAVPLIVVCQTLAPDIVWVIAGPGYEGAVLPLRIMLPLIFVIGYEQILVTQTLMPAGCDRVVLRNSFVGAVVGIGLSMAMVPSLKACGSAAVWVACEVCVMVLSQRAVSRRHEIFFPWGSLLRALVTAVPLVLLLPMAAGHIVSPVWRIVTGVVTILAYFIDSITKCKNLRTE